MLSRGPVGRGLSALPALAGSSKDHSAAPQPSPISSKGSSPQLRVPNSSQGSLTAPARLTIGEHEQPSFAMNAREHSPPPAPPLPGRQISGQSLSSRGSDVQSEVSRSGSGYIKSSYI